MVLGVLVLFITRKRRDDDDDPLSPFELSMDKGYPQNYNPGASGMANNTSALSRSNVGNSNNQDVNIDTNTPPAGAVAAGLAYTQFYDSATSPNSMQHQLELQSQADMAAKDDAASNIWLSAMEIKENDSYLSAHEEEAGDDHSFMSSQSRGSYDRSQGVDADNSSVISGGSDLNSAKDHKFPEFEDESARDSYEL